MTTTPRCAWCGSECDVVPVIWGMPEPEVDPRAVLAGCTMGFGPVTAFYCHACRADMWDDGGLVSEPVAVEFLSGVGGEECGGALRYVVAEAMRRVSWHREFDLGERRSAATIVSSREEYLDLCEDMGEFGAAYLGVREASGDASHAVTVAVSPRPEESRARRKQAESVRRVFDGLDCEVVFADSVPDDGQWLPSLTLDVRREVFCDSSTGEVQPCAERLIVALADLIARRSGWDDIERVGPPSEWSRPCFSTADLADGEEFGPSVLDLQCAVERLLDIPYGSLVFEDHGDGLTVRAANSEDSRELELECPLTIVEVLVRVGREFMHLRETNPSGRLRESR